MMDQEKIAISIVSSPEHALPGHPESPQRFEFFEDLASPPIASHLLKITPEPAPEERLLAVHEAAYLDRLRSSQEEALSFLDYGDTYATDGSFEAARLACGACLGVTQAVLERRATSGFALVRPPGHHATTAQAMGFCLLNNLAIAVRYAQGMGLQRVLIYDFDVHHGNGTQAVFESDPDVLYISTHQWGIFPGTGHWKETGRGKGAGSVINVPLPAYAGWEAFHPFVDRILIPAARRFQPQAIFVSAGFDAHYRDPLASLQLSAEDFYRLAQIVHSLAQEFCDGRLILTLEGGYDPRALSASIEMVLRALCGEKPGRDPYGPSPKEQAHCGALIESVADLHGLGGA